MAWCLFDFFFLIREERCINKVPGTSNKYKVCTVGAHSVLSPRSLCWGQAGVLGASGNARHSGAVLKKRSGLPEWQVCVWVGEICRQKEGSRRKVWLSLLFGEAQPNFSFGLESGDHFICFSASDCSDRNFEWNILVLFYFCQHNLTFYFHPCGIIRHVFISLRLVCCNECILDILKNESTADCWSLELTLIATKQMDFI